MASLPELHKARLGARASSLRLLLLTIILPVDSSSCAWQYGAACCLSGTRSGGQLGSHRGLQGAGWRGAAWWSSSSSSTGSGDTRACRPRRRAVVRSPGDKGRGRMAGAWHQAFMAPRSRAVECSGSSSTGSGVRRAWRPTRRAVGCSPGQGGVATAPGRGGWEPAWWSTPQRQHRSGMSQAWVPKRGGERSGAWHVPWRRRRRGAGWRGGASRSSSPCWGVL